MSRSPGHLMWWWIIPLLLLACGLGARKLNYDILWLDEYVSFYFAGAEGENLSSPFEAAQYINTQTWERHTPGYALLLNLWMHIFGTSEFAGRLLSLFAGLLALAWMYRLGKDVGESSTAGVCAATIVGITALFTHHLHEMRMYMLTMLLTIILLWAYWRWCQMGRWSLRPALVIVIFANLVVFVYSSALILLVGLGVYHVFFAQRKANWWQVTSVLVVTGLVMALWFLPWLTPRWQNIGSDKDRLIGEPIEYLLGEVATQFSNGVPILLILWGCVSLLALRTRAGFWAWFTFVFNVGAVLIGSTAFPIWNVRNFTPAYPVFGLAVGLGIGASVRQKISFVPLLLALWIVLGVWHSMQPRRAFQVGPIGPSKADFYQVYHLLDQCAQPGDKAIFKLDGAVPNQWWGGILYHYMPNARFPYVEMRLARERDEATMQQALFVLDAERLWFVNANYLNVGDEIGPYERKMLSDFQHCPQSLQLQDLTVELYARLSADSQSSVCPPPQITTLDAATCPPGESHAP